MKDKLMDFIVNGQLLLVALALGLLMVLLCGCSHNVTTAFQGKAFNVGYDPEMHKFGIQYYNGVVASGINRENTKTNFSFVDTFDVNGKKTSSKMTYNTEIGKQTTGYQVELEKAKQEKK